TYHWLPCRTGPSSAAGAVRCAASAEIHSLASARASALSESLDVMTLPSCVIQNTSCPSGTLLRRAAGFALAPSGAVRLRGASAAVSAASAAGAAVAKTLAARADAV